MAGDRFNTSVDIAELSSSPSAPSSGYFRIYPKTDGKMYGKNSANVEYDLTFKWAQVTQADYDALSPPDANTLYLIVG